MAPSLSSIFGRVLCRLGLHRKGAAFNGYRHPGGGDTAYAYVICPRCGKRPDWVVQDERRRR